MSVHLLFDESDRLCAQTQIAPAYGEMDSLSVFFAEDQQERNEHIGFVGIDLAPEILHEIRPPVWAGLVTHARRTREGLQVDSLDAIHARLTRHAIGQQEIIVFSLAKELALSKLAETLLGCVPKAAQKELGDLARRLDQERATLVAITTGENRIAVSKMLVDLAGKLLPL